MDDERLDDLDGVDPPEAGDDIDPPEAGDDIDPPEAGDDIDPPEAGDGVDIAAGRPVEERVETLAEQALETQVAFEPPNDPDERAMTYLREGLWPVIDAYIDVVSAGDRLEQRAHDHLETAVNVWLELYARCYGASIDAEYPVRKVAEVFVDTHNIRDTAQLLTGVPERDHAGQEG